MHQIFKPLLAAFVLTMGTTTFSISADTIRLKGPSGELIDAPQYSEPMRAVDNTTLPTRYYGPTERSETLWSIASRFRPENSTTQQTIYAFYQLNPSAFEQDNIHQLNPGSRLRIPSEEQITATNLQQALSILAAHQDKLKPQIKRQSKPEPEVKPQPAKPASVVKATTDSKNNQLEVVPEAASDIKPLEPSSTKTNAQPLVSAQKQLADKLQQELTRSESELLSLEERNHQLRLMLSEVQSEVESLKNEVSNEERIRQEVERQLADERRKQAEIERMAPSQWDIWLAKPWFVGLLAVVPALIIGLVTMLMLRGRKSGQIDEPATTKDSSASEAVVFGAAAGASALMAEENDSQALFDDDLLSGLDDRIDIDEPDAQQEKADEHDIFADLNDTDLDFNLDDEDDVFSSIGDDGELDLGYVDLDESTNGISVKDGEKALGLEEMERVLNDVSMSSNEDLDLDLSDDEVSLDEPVSQADLDALFSSFAGEELEQDVQDVLNQSDMDELLSGDNFDLGLDSDDFELPATSTKTATVSNDDIDDLFAQFSAVNERDAITDASVSLLDEQLDSDLELSDLEDSDLMLDEFVASTEGLETSTPSSTFNEVEIEVNEDSTELLDELLFENTFNNQEDEFDIDPLSSGDLFSSDFESDQDDIDALLSNTAESEEPAFDASQDDIDALLSDTVESEEQAFDASQDDIDALLSDTAELEVPAFDASQDDIDALPSDTAESEEQAFDVSQDDIDALLSVTAESGEQAFDASQDDIDTLLSDTVESEEQAFDVSQDDIDLLLNDTGEPAGETVDTSQIDIDALLNDSTESAEARSTPLDEKLAETVESIKTPITDTNSINDGASVNKANVPESEFNFAPEIESVANLPQESIDAEQQQFEMDNLLANEFGVPQDEDWFVDNEIAVEEAVRDTHLTEQASDDDHVTEQADDLDFLNAALNSDYSEEQALADYQNQQDLLVDEGELTSPCASEDDYVIDDADLPEYGEEDALAQLNADGGEIANDEETQESGKQQFESLFNEEMVGETLNHSEIDALASAFSMLDSNSLEQEGELDELLRDSSATFSNISPIDQEKVDSAGLDLAAMLDESLIEERGGEDWNGFTLTDEQLANIDNDIPEDQQEIWSSNSVGSLSKASDEDWSSQDPDTDFEGESGPYLTIDDLMHSEENEMTETAVAVDEELKLDVGLDEFPDVIGEISNVDVDDESEAAGNLDLANIYIEMNDIEGAINLLEKVKADGSEQLKQQADRLLSKLSDYSHY